MNLIERLRKKHECWSDRIVTMNEAADEIERLTADKEHWESLWREKCERQQSEIERLTMERDALKKHYPEWQANETKRLRAALEHLKRATFTHSDTAAGVIGAVHVIAREALKDD